MWCSRMVVAPKKDGTPQRTVDLQRLNAATHREMHHTPSPFNLVSSIPTGKLKTVLDAWNGYHSLPLTSAGKEATTFITEWGRYRYRRAPMGFHASGDAYTRRFDDITAGQKRVVRCVDDSLLWDSDIESAFWHTCKYIKLCADSGIIFNRDKFTFAEATAEFAGFEITMDSYRPPKRIIAAIRDFPTPKNITDIRAWFGLVNQVAYSFAQAQVMAPFRELLASKTRLFYWDETMDALFQRSELLKMRYATSYKREFVHSRSIGPHVYPQTGRKRVSVSHSCRNTVDALRLLAQTADWAIGNWFSPGLDSQEVQRVGMRQSRAKRSPWYMHCTVVACS